MNDTLVLGLWRQRLASPIRMVVLGLMVVLPPALMATIRGVGFSALGDGYPLALVFAVGMIGQDVSSGVLQLLLARPVRRWEYVISRWLSAALGASIVSVLQIGLAWALTAMHGSAPEPGLFAQFALGRELQIFGVCATMALLSSLIAGVGDLAIYVVLNILGGILGMVGQFQHSALLIAVGQEIGGLLSPRLDMAQIAAGSISWFAVATYASNLTLCLVLSIVVMSRKELSYASS